MLFNPLPCSSVCGVEHCRHGHPKRTREIAGVPVRFNQLAYLAHNFWSQFAVSYCRPSGNAIRHGFRVVCITLGVAALCLAVLHVVSLCSKKQVLGVDASTDIAPVANEHAAGDRAVGKFPRDSVRKVRPSTPPTNSDHSVSGCGSGSSPQPTGVRTAGLVNLGPESLCYTFLSHARPFRVWSGAGPRATTRTGSVFLTAYYNTDFDRGAVFAC